jgi:choline-sulfatase
MKQPNILFIMTDQLNRKVLPMFGSGGCAITPNLSRLADEGVVFDNFYCNSPLCAPSRSSMMTSLHINRCGVYDNAAELPASIPTFVHYLRLRGYETVLSGKMHFVGPDQLHGFERRLTTDIYPADFSWTYDWSREPIPLGGTTVDKVEMSGVCATNNQIIYDEEAHFRARDFLRNRSLGGDGPAGSREGEDRPFFLCVSYTHPHDPFMTTQEYWDLYDEVEIPDPIPGPEAFDGYHDHNRSVQITHDLKSRPPSMETVRRARRGYLGMVSYLDRLVGDLLGDLERLELREDTVVVFTSDHGDMQGDHGMWFKRTFYEASAGVPLIVSWPGEFAPAHVAEAASLIDIGPTMVALSGGDTARYESESDGRSLAGVLRGTERSRKDEAIVEYCGEGARSPMIMVRRGKMKYVCFHGFSSLLFDLENDPDELVDLAQDPAYAETVRELHAAAVRDLDLERLNTEVIRSQKARFLIQKSLQRGRRTAWDFQTHRDESRTYVRGENVAEYLK